MNMTYNGADYPVVPQREGYPNAVIFATADGPRLVLLSEQQPWDVEKNTFGGVEVGWVLFALNENNDEWVEASSAYEYFFPVVDTLIWSNYDILNDEDDTVYFAASAPTYPFVITHTIRADLLERGVRPRVDVVQGDALTRRVEFIMTAGGVPWTPPDDTTAAFSYVRPDGVGKVYDKLSDGVSAYTVSGNRIRFTLLPEMLTVAGEVQAALRILRASDKHLLSTFVFDIVVEAEPSYLVNPPENTRGILPASIIAVKSDADVIVTAEYTDGSSDVTLITLDDNGDPVVVERQGQTCTLIWGGFDE